MLPLASKEWSRLTHAYGSAGDIPKLLLQLASFPPSGVDAEPWDALWSALCHQGDVYPSSFAAVPHIVTTLAVAPDRAGFDYYLLPAAIDVARAKKDVQIPEELAPAYRSALERLPTLAAAALRPSCDATLCQAALAASAVGAGDTDLATLLLEVEHSDIGDVLDWYFSR